MAATQSSFAAALPCTAAALAASRASGSQAADSGGRIDGSLVFRVPLSSSSSATQQAQRGHGRIRAAKRRVAGMTATPSPPLPRATAVGYGATTDESASSSSAASATEDAPESSMTAKKKRWYAQRRDERDALQKELEELRALKELYEQTPPERAVAAAARRRENAQLQRALMEQQLQFARAQSIVTGTSNPHRAPFAKFIHLPTDWDDRARALAELKHGALHDAERYVAERVRFLNPAVRLAQSERFDMPNGDVHFTGFNVIPLPLDGVTSSVKKVFEAIRLFYYNMEITYTELSGEVMVREGDYDLTGDNGVKTQRFVRRTAFGAQVESNSVLFSVLREGDGGGAGSSSSGSSSMDGGVHRVNSDGSVGESAVFLADFVDRDERFPYSAGERVRQDTTATISVKAYPRSMLGEVLGDPLRQQHQHTHQHQHGQHQGRAGPPASSTPAAAPSPYVIVLSGAYYAHMHLSPVLGMPPDAVEGMSFASNFCFKTLIRTVVEYLNVSAQVDAEMS